MSKTTGVFYFKRTNYGNLIGEFTNDKSDAVITESASPMAGTSDFLGNYQSVWFDTTLHNSTLSISKLKDKYKLEYFRFKSFKNNSK